MKQQTTQSIQAPLFRGVFYLLLLLPIRVSPFALAQRHATKRNGGQAWQREQTTGQRGHGLPANIIVVTTTSHNVKA